MASWSWKRPWRAAILVLPHFPMAAAVHIVRGRPGHSSRGRAAFVELRESRGSPRLLTCPLHPPGISTFCNLWTVVFKLQGAMQRAYYYQLLVLALPRNSVLQENSPGGMYTLPSRLMFCPLTQSFHPPSQGLAVSVWRPHCPLGRRYSRFCRTVGEGASPGNRSSSRRLLSSGLGWAPGQRGCFPPPSGRGKATAVGPGFGVWRHRGPRCFGSIHPKVPTPSLPWRGLAFAQKACAPVPHPFSPTARRDVPVLLAS